MCFTVARRLQVPLSTGQWLADRGTGLGTIVAVSELLRTLFDDLVAPLAGRLAPVAAWAVAAAVLSRLTGRWATWRVKRLIARGAHHKAGVTSALAWLGRVALWVLVIAAVVDAFDLPVGSLVPVATVVGFALGWGLQRVVLDVLAGFFLLAERQFAVGDLIRISAPGQTDGIEGRVEELTLRVVKLRTFEGDLVTLANSELRQVANLSRDWARVIIDIDVDLDGEWDLVAARVEELCAELAGDSEFGADLLEAPTVAGVEAVSTASATIRVTGRVRPGRQRRVARELRSRIAASLAVELRVATSPPTGEVPVVKRDR
jgi:moderate conductance mechanosensitive channel